MLNTARAHHITLSSGRLYSTTPALTLTLGFRHAGLHFLHTLSHPGAVGDVILRARYYAFISKYLDSTDLFLRRRRSSFFSRLLQASWLALVALPPLFFPLYALTLSLSALTAAFTLALALTSPHSTSLPVYCFSALRLSTAVYCCFALANLEPRWRRLTEFLIRNILPAFRKVPFHTGFHRKLPRMHSVTVRR